MYKFQTESSSRGNSKNVGGNLPTTSQPGKKKDLKEINKNHSWRVEFTKEKIIPLIKNDGKKSGNCCESFQQSIGMAVPKSVGDNENQILKLQVSPGSSSVASLV